MRSANEGVRTKESNSKVRIKGSFIFLFVTQHLRQDCHRCGDFCVISVTYTYSNLTPMTRDTVLF